MALAMFYDTMVQVHELPNGLIISANNATRNGQKYFTYDEAKSFEREVMPYGWRLPTMSEMIGFCRRHDGSPLKSQKDGYIREGESVPCHRGEAAYYWLSDEENPTEVRALVDFGTSVNIIQTSKNKKLAIRLVKAR